MGSGGGLWDVLDDITKERMNQKTLVISTSAPTTTYAGMLWYDSDDNILYMRNGANNTWVNAINQSLLTTSSPTFAALTINGNLTISGTVDGVDISGLLIKTTKVTDLATIWDKTTKIVYGDTNFADQALLTTSSPTFAKLTLTTDETVDKVKMRSGVIQYSSDNMLTKSFYLENALGFRIPYKVEKWNSTSSTWDDITASATWGYLNDNKPSTGVNCGQFCEAGHTVKIRFYYDSGSTWKTPADTLLVNRQHLSYIDYIKVEHATDAAMTTDLETLKEYSTPLSGGDSLSIIPTSSWWRRYLRIELDLRETNASYYNDLIIREIMYMSPAFYSGSRLFDSVIPIDWNYNKEVYFSNLIRPTANNSYDIGTSSYKFKNAYLSGNLNVDGTVDGVDISDLLLKTTKVGDLFTIWNKTTKITSADINFNTTASTKTTDLGNIWDKTTKIATADIILSGTPNAKATDPTALCTYATKLSATNINLNAVAATKTTDLANLWDKTTKIAFADTSITKSDLGLGSVENTALSTWAGTNKITTLGTVATGVWNASTISASKVDLSGVVPTSRTVNGHTLSSNVTVTKSDVGLGSVENTAISTWGGSSNIVTVGTIATGVWHGSVIDKTYLEASGMLATEKSKFADGATNSVIGTSAAHTSEYISPSGGAASSSFANIEGIPTTNFDYNQTISQRVLGYAQGYWWCFVANTLYKSLNGITNWTIVDNNVIASGFAGGIYIDSSNYIHIVADKGAYNNQPLYYRRGLLSTDGTVTWSAIQTIEAANYSYYYNSKNISMLGNGKIVVYVDWVNGGSNFTPKVYKNNNTDGTWANASSYPMTIGDNTTRWGNTYARSDNSILYVYYNVNDSTYYYKIISSANVLGSGIQLSTKPAYSNEGYFCVVDDNSNNMEIVYYVSSTGVGLYTKTLSSSNVLSTETQLSDTNATSLVFGFAVSKKNNSNSDLIVYALNSVYYLYALERNSGVWDSSWTRISVNSGYGNGAATGWNAPLINGPTGLYFGKGYEQSFYACAYYTKINYLPNRICDNSTSTQWRPYPVNNTTNTYIDISFTSSIISGCRVYWGADANYRPSSFKFQALENGSWVDKLTVNSQPSEGWAEYSWTNPSATNKIRLVLLTAGATGSEVYEIDVYSPSWAKHYHNWTI